MPHRLGGGAPTLAEANRMDADEAAEKAARRAQRADPTEAAGVARMEPVFRTLEIAVSWATKAIGTRITYQGLENIPDTRRRRDCDQPHELPRLAPVRAGGLSNGTAGCGS